MERYDKGVMAGVLAVACGLAMPLTTVQADEVALKREILNLKHRIERLEKSRRAADEEKSGPFEKVDVSGLIEVEAGCAEGAGASESGLVVATIELGLEAQVTPWVDVHALILFEEGETGPPVLDEAIVTFANAGESPISLVAGRMYLPFGHYESALVSDPLTLEIGETRERALQLGYVSGGFSALAWLADGDTKEGGSKSIGQFGVQLGFSHEKGGYGYDVGISWTRNLADSDRLQEVVTDRTHLTGKVAGASVYAVFSRGPFTIIGEYLAASKAFDVADLAFDGVGARPAAMNLEADYCFKVAGREAGVAIAWQQTREASALALPKTRWLAAFSVVVHEKTTLALEVAHDEDYEVSDGGSGEDTDTITAQLSLAF